MDCYLLLEKKHLFAKPRLYGYGEDKDWIERLKKLVEKDSKQSYRIVKSKYARIFLG